MKSTLLKSIATLLGVGAVLSLNVLAGPGAQPATQSQKERDGKTVVAEHTSRASFTMSCWAASRWTPCG